MAQFAPWVETHPLLAILVLVILVLLLIAGVLLYVMSTPMGRAYTHPSGWIRPREAEERAEAFLCENVSDQEYQQLLQDGYLEVPSSLYPGRCYRIPRRPGRVKVYEFGCKTGELCVFPLDPVPYADLILTHKWMVEADERKYLSIANRIGRISI